jgi:Ricin-type beta-trefoil lectin domain
VSRLLFTALTGSTLLTSLMLAPAPAQAADFPTTLIGANISGVSKCIGPRNGETTNGTPAVLMDCNQVWRGTGRDRSVRNFAGKCLGITAGHPVPTPLGTPLVLSDCTNPTSGDQQWTFVAVHPGGQDGLWVLRNPASLRCVNMANGGTATGTPLVMQNCSFRSDQQWVLPNLPPTYGFDWDDGTTL